MHILLPHIESFISNAIRDLAIEHPTFSTRIIPIQDFDKEIILGKGVSLITDVRLSIQCDLTDYIGKVWLNVKSNAGNHSIKGWSINSMLCCDCLPPLNASPVCNWILSNGDVIPLNSPISTSSNQLADVIDLSFNGNSITPPSSSIDPPTLANLLQYISVETGIVSAVDGDYINLMYLDKSKEKVILDLAYACSSPAASKCMQLLSISNPGGMQISELPTFSFVAPSSVTLIDGYVQILQINNNSPFFPDTDILTPKQPTP